jgi:hypothetical protein
MEASALEVPEERAPACLLFFGPFADAENPPVNGLTGGDLWTTCQRAMPKQPTLGAFAPLWQQLLVVSGDGQAGKP